MSFQAARDVSTLILPQQDSQELVARGVTNREARRRAVFRNWLWERISNLVFFLMASAIVMPMAITLVLLLTLFTAKFYDIISGRDAGGMVANFIFGHFFDECSQPLGELCYVFWIFLAIKMTSIYIWSKCMEVQADCDCNCLRNFFLAVIMPPTVAFELLWPVTTFVYLCLAQASGDCSKGLVQSCWLLLSPYFLQVFGILMSMLWPLVKPLLYRAGVIPDPGNRTRDFQRVNFRQEDFNEEAGGYPASCSICLADFAASDTDIVVTPCQGQKHVFHRSCLASWFRVSQSCPLCRTILSRAPAADGEAPLAQNAAPGPAATGP